MNSLAFPEPYLSCVVVEKLPNSGSVTPCLHQVQSPDLDSDAIEGRPGNLGRERTAFGRMLS